MQKPREENLKELIEQEAEKEQALRETLRQKEAEDKKLDKAMKHDKKRLKQIEQSRTWRYTRPLQKVMAGSKNKIKHQQKQIQDLEQELSETRQALKKAEAQLQLEHENQETDIAASIKALKQEGNIMDYLDTALQQKKRYDSHYTKALAAVADQYRHGDPDVCNMIYTKVLSGMKTEDIPEFMVRATEADETLSLKQAASFRGNLTLRARQQQLGNTLPEYVLDNKQAAYTFAEKLGVRVPWISEASGPFSSIPKQEGIVIKPAGGAGSRGVYLVFGYNEIVDVKRSNVLQDWHELEASIKDDLYNGLVAQDDWIIEELIYEKTNHKKTLANDVKFYCFYGKIELILEITRYPELKYCWWTANGERVRTGKYDDNLFKGNGVTKQEIDLAASISEQIPAPFIRIDFLRANGELTFGEFTPKPGNYDEFSQPVDKWLGDCFLAAQGRLTDDLIKGKQFSAYNEWTNKQET